MSDDIGDLAVRSARAVDAAMGDVPDAIKYATLCSMMTALIISRFPVEIQDEAHDMVMDHLTEMLMKVKVEARELMRAHFEPRRQN